MNAIFGKYNEYYSEHIGRVKLLEWDQTRYRLKQNIDIHSLPELSAKAPMCVWGLTVQWFYCILSIKGKIKMI